jgi:hypothetical protein
MYRREKALSVSRELRQQLQSQSLHRRYGQSTRIDYRQVCPGRTSLSESLQTRQLLANNLDGPTHLQVLQPFLVGFAVFGFLRCDAMDYARPRSMALRRHKEDDWMASPRRYKDSRYEEEDGLVEQWKSFYTMIGWFGDCPINACDGNPSIFGGFV